MIAIPSSQQRRTLHLCFWFFFTVVITFFWSFSQAHAVTLRVEGARGEILFEREKKIAVPTSVGEISVLILNENRVSYTGGETGISEMFKLGSRLDIFSDSEMKAYGWCFAVDNITPETMANETFVKNEKSTVNWFYGYALYKNGEWVRQCQRNK